MHMILCCVSRTILIPNNRRYIRWEMPKRHCAENYKLWSNCGFCVWESWSVTWSLPIRSLTSTVGGSSSCVLVVSTMSETPQVESLLNKMYGLMCAAHTIKSGSPVMSCSVKSILKSVSLYMLSASSICRLHAVWVRASYSDEYQRNYWRRSACMTWKPHMPSCPITPFCNEVFRSGTLDHNILRNLFVFNATGKTPYLAFISRIKVLNICLLQTIM